MAGVRIGEQQVELARAQLFLERRSFLIHLALQVAVTLGQLHQLDEVARAPLEAVPRSELLTQLRRIARHLTGAPGVVPDSRLGELGV